VEIDELTAEEEDAVPGQRVRKEVDYSDSLNDRDWLKAIGAVDDEGNEILEDEEEDSGKKRGRGRGAGRPSKRDDDDKPRKKRGRPAGGTSQRQRAAMRQIIGMVVDYVDADGRVLSEPFMKLPSRRDLPDYYKVIRKPVDIKKVLNRIDDPKDARHYLDMDDLEADFFLLCKNAQAYNEEASLIHEDSIVLERVFTNARVKIEAELEAQQTEPPPAAAENAEREEEEDAEEADDSGGGGGGKRKGRGSGRNGTKKKRKLVIEDDDDDDDGEEEEG